MAGCGDRAPRVPTGEPLSVVRASADRTLQLGVVRVFIEGPEESLETEIDLSGDASPSPARDRVLAALDLARRATGAVPYGGQQIRGTSTMRYEVTTSEGAQIDLWIDVEGRLRRAELPDGPVTSGPPPTQPNGLAALVTIDLIFDNSD